ncbi:MAG TPA: DUF2852 domain-containing protein [Stellaceae bacterium]|nr:DUF2852 domain-containing protein [Stellaceae bacterium]
MSVAAGVAERLDEIGKPVWIALMILGFALFWPLGLALLAFLLWSGRMGCWKHGRFARWHEHGGLERMQERMRRWHDDRPASSGNRAFDDYREATLRRLEEEEREFRDFLDRLRLAKDKAEFDQFLAERRRPPEAPQPQG